MTLLQIAVLLHYYVIPNEDYKGYQVAPPIIEKTLDFLETHGFLNKITNPNCSYATTTKAAVFVKALTEVRQPVMAWAMPL